MPYQIARLNRERRLPEENLVIAIIVRGIDDYFRVSKINKQDHRSAIEFVEGEDMARLCDLVNIEGEEVRRRVMAIMEEKKSNPSSPCPYERLRKKLRWHKKNRS